MGQILLSACAEGLEYSVMIECWSSAEAIFLFWLKFRISRKLDYTARRYDSLFSCMKMSSTRLPACLGHIIALVS